MRAAFLRLRVKVLRFFRQKELRFFEDKTSKTLKFRGEDEASIFEEFYGPSLYAPFGHLSFANGAVTETGQQFSD